MERPPEYQAQQGLTLYFLGKLHSGLKKLSAYYRQRGVKVFNVSRPEDLERACKLSRPHVLVIDLQSRSEITSFFEALGEYEGLLELPRIAIISSNADDETSETLKAQSDAFAEWPLKAIDLSSKLFELMIERDHYVQIDADPEDKEGRHYRGQIVSGYLRNLVLLLYLGRRDSVLSLECEGRRGNLYFKEGRLIDAQVGALEWQDSLNLVRRFKTGSLVLSFQPVDRKRFIDKNVTSWLVQDDDDEMGPPVAVVPEPEEETAVGPLPGSAPGDPAVTTPELEAAEAAQVSPEGQRPPVGDEAAPPAGREGPETRSEAPPAEARQDPERIVAPMPPSLDPMMPPPPTSPPPREGEAASAVSSLGGPTGASLATSPRGLAPERFPGGAVAGQKASRSSWPVVALFALLFVFAGYLIWRLLPDSETTQVVQVPTPRNEKVPLVLPAETPRSAPTQARVRQVTPKPAVATPKAVPAAKPVPTPKPAKVIPAPPESLSTPRIEEPVGGGRQPLEVAKQPTPKPERLAKVIPPKPAPTLAPPRSTPAPPSADASTPAPVRVEEQTPGSEPVIVASVPDSSSPGVTFETATMTRPERNLRKARELEKAGKLQEALAVYTQVAELDPISREASDAIMRLKGGAEIDPMAPAELHINAFPYGIVYVDGEKHGYTPVHLNKVVPRKYLIRVVNPEVGACSIEVLIKPGDQKWIHLRLDDEESCRR